MLLSQSLTNFNQASEYPGGGENPGYCIFLAICEMLKNVITLWKFNIRIDEEYLDVKYLEND